MMVEPTPRLCQWLKLMTWVKMFEEYNCEIMIWVQLFEVINFESV